MTQERFWSKVNKTDNCWLWTASLTDGYGAYWDKSLQRVRKASRVSLEWHLGRPLYPGMEACHGPCHNRACVNPAHLSEKSKMDNNKDRIRDGSNGRKLTLTQARLIRTDPRSQRIIALEYGISQHAVWSIKNNHSWSE